MASGQELRRFRANLADELHSAAIYETLSRVERDHARKEVFSDFAASERMHARVWAGKLKENGRRAPSGFTKTYLMKGLVHLLGPRVVLSPIAAAEFADRNKYAGNPDAAGMSEDEQRHASVVRAMANAGMPAAAQGSDVAQAESWQF